MESRITMINKLRKTTGIGAGLAHKCLLLADYEMELAIRIAEYYGIAVNKSYPVGRVIRDYWTMKSKEECW